MKQFKNILMLRLSFAESFNVGSNSIKSLFENLQKHFRNKKTKGKGSLVFRAVSLKTAFVFLFQSINPISLLALSNGPSQPEVETFQQIGVSDIVDPFTGDMSYNIPLMNVPGPGGGYPINLVYNAGIGMEQEATWVGLGWNINSGSISRDMRGLPDDLNGQEVVKDHSQFDNTTVSIGGEFGGIEVLGLGDKGLSVSTTFSYNTYKGFGSRLGAGVTPSKAKQGVNAIDDSPVSNTNNSEEDASRSAQDEQVTVSPVAESKNKNRIISHLESTTAQEIYKSSFYKRFMSSGQSIIRGGTSFANASSLHSIGGGNDIETSSFALQGNFKTGVTIFGVTGDLSVNAYLSRLKFHDGQRRIPGFGYFYNSKTAGEDFFLSDFYRDKDKTVSIDSKILPYPVQTYDLFHVSGHGVSGVARAHSNSIQQVREMTVEHRTSETGRGIEFNTLISENKGGVNPWDKVSKSESGEWKQSGSLANLFRIGVENYDLLNDELMFFSFSDNMGVEGMSSSYLPNQRRAFANKIENDNNYSFSANVYDKRPVLTNKVHYKNNVFLNLQYSNLHDYQRKPRGKIFNPITFNRLSAMNFHRTYYEQSSPNAITEDLYDVSESDYDGLFGRIDVIDEGGKSYVYGLPVITHEHSDYSYSTDEHSYGASSNPISSLVNFNSTEASKENKSGNDRFFSKTTIPKYAHSFLLTEILSDDYRDIDNVEGPSQNDLGSYVKIDYFRQLEKMGSRNPYSKASFIPGNYSFKDDDKATFSYFEKEIYYTKTIETKTHIAVFTLNDDANEARKDSRGVNRNGVRQSNQRSRYLKRIDLYEINSYLAAPQNAVPIKTVNFEYDYELCKGVLNNIDPSEGKLTLKKVWFSTGERKTQKSLHPYEFEYANNVDYNQDYVSPWGDYYPDYQNEFGYNNTSPYLPNALSNLLDENNASTWNLTAINLPSGGRISIDYEYDDYMHVQDKRAMNMYKVLGFARNPNDPLSTYIGRQRNYVVVSLPKKINSHEVNDYIRGVDYMYFKMMIGLRPAILSNRHVDVVSSSNNTKFDYIQGYVKIDKAGLYDVDTESTSDKIWIELDYNTISQLNPIRKAALIHLKNYRTDLNPNNTFGIDNVNAFNVGLLNGLLNGVKSFFSGNGFFTKSISSGHCSDIADYNTDINANDYPSMVRLNVNRFVEKRKIGGGHRVKRVKINDNWGQMSGNDKDFEYGYEYSYALPDGTSSGVAQYEPSLGGETNPLRQPVKYGTNRLLIKDKLLFDELPVGEAFMPSPMVGYSRVTVKNIQNEGFGEKSGGGVTVKEFYTAKDYPVITESTTVNKLNTDWIRKSLGLLGMNHFWHPGYSQGIYVELNDMHGKQKSISVYPSSHTDDSPKVELSRVTYRYKTLGGYKPGKANMLNNSVMLLYGDANTLQKNVGSRSDLVIDLQKHSSSNYGYNINTNLGGGVVGILPIVWGMVDNFKENYQVSTSMSVMVHTKSLNGVLESITETKEGSETTVENMMFDPYTGDVLLSSITDRFGGEKFTYKMPAYWMYPEMGPAYKTINALRSSSSTNQLMPGDVLFSSSSGDRYWVESLEENSGSLDLTLVSENNQSSSSLPGVMRVEKPAYKNRLHDVACQLTSLVNPASDAGRNWRLFDEYNMTYRPQFTIGNYGVGGADFIDCDLDATYINGNLELAGKKIQEPPKIMFVKSGNFIDLNDYVHFSYFTGDCNVGKSTEVYVVFPEFIEDQGAAAQYNIYYSGSGSYAVAKHVATGDQLLCEVITQNTDCFEKCISSVLDITVADYNDEISTISDPWLPDNFKTLQDLNKYRYGKKGLWRQESTYAYQEEREQNTGTTPGNPFTTRIDDSDGIYEEFSMFNWNPAADNGYWTRVSTNTKYNSSGQVAEVRDALGIYQAALFGYGGDLVTASGQNTTYDELIFDGFEDHGSSYDSDFGRGNLRFPPGRVSLENGTSHTGLYSLRIDHNNVNVELSNLEIDTRYVVSLWRKTDDVSGNIYVNTGTSQIDLMPVTDDIDGWTLYEANFLVSVQAPSLVFDSQNILIDDLRVFRQSGNVRSFVYEHDTHRVKAILDEQNFAMHYIYNDAGDLIQVRKETVKGMQTLKGHRKGKATLPIN